MKNPWVIMVSVVGFLGALGAAGATVEQYRWWAPRDMFEFVADESLSNSINQRYDFLTLEQRELRFCEEQAKANPGQDCLSVQRRIRELEQKIRELEQKQLEIKGSKS